MTLDETLNTSLLGLREEETKATRSRRTIDPELRAMDSMLSSLEELQPAAQGRVLIWLADRCTEVVQAIRGILLGGREETP